MSIKRQSKSRQWRKRQEADPQVRAARVAGYRSRAAYKLIEMNAALKFLRMGAKVVDLGAAPGGWSQVVVKEVGATKGTVIAVDKLPMQPIQHVCTIQGDFCDAKIVESIKTQLNGKADVVLSDMAPNLSGIAATDQSQMAELVMAALDFADAVLMRGGVFIAKSFQGECADSVRADIAQRLCMKKNDVRVFRPQATRSYSREIYLCVKRTK